MKLFSLFSEIPNSHSTAITQTNRPFLSITNVEHFLNPLGASNKNTSTNNQCENEENSFAKSRTEDLLNMINIAENQAGDCGRRAPEFIDFFYPDKYKNGFFLLSEVDQEITHQDSVFIPGSPLDKKRKSAESSSSADSYEITLFGYSPGSTQKKPKIMASSTVCDLKLAPPLEEVGIENRVQEEDENSFGNSRTCDFFNTTKIVENEAGDCGRRVPEFIDFFEPEKHKNGIYFRGEVDRGSTHQGTIFIPDSPKDKKIKYVDSSDITLFGYSVGSIRKKSKMEKNASTSSTVYDLKLAPPLGQVETENRVQVRELNLMPEEYWEIKKSLTRSDINGSSRLLLNKEAVKKNILPQLKNFEEKAGIEIGIRDVDTDTDHILILKKWGSESYVLNKSWIPQFVTRRKLKENDEIGLRWDHQKSQLQFTVLHQN